VVLILPTISHGLHGGQSRRYHGLVPITARVQDDRGPQSHTLAVVSINHHCHLCQWHLSSCQQEADCPWHLSLPTRILPKSNLFCFLAGKLPFSGPTVRVLRLEFRRVGTVVKLVRKLFFKKISCGKKSAAVFRDYRHCYCQSPPKRQGRDSHCTPRPDGQGSECEAIVRGLLQVCIPRHGTIPKKDLGANAANGVVSVPEVPEPVPKL